MQLHQHQRTENVQGEDQWKYRGEWKEATASRKSFAEKASFWNGGQGQQEGAYLDDGHVNEPGVITEKYHK